MIDPKTITDPHLRAFHAGLTAPHHRILDRMKHLLLQADHGLIWHRQLGAAAIDLRGTPSRFTYGQRWVGNVASLLGCKRSLLIRSARLAAHFSEGDTIELEALDLSMAVAFATLPLRRHSQRLTLLRQAARRHWTAARVRAEIRRRMNRPSPCETGRPPRRPDLRAAGTELQDLILTAARWRKYLNTTWLAPDGLLELIQADDVSLPQDLLREAIRELMMVGTLTSRLRRELSRITPS